jgi:SSS family solute:Na+ symporter
MAFIDWLILGLFVLFLLYTANKTAKYSKSVSHFLSAGRSAGRYLLTMSDGIAGIGAITIIGSFQMIYKSGFSAGWWGQLGIPVGILMAIGGWVIYRFRQTKALTMAQFFEMRYSRNFRVLAGSICYISGILNFGIFPAVAANFFITYCGFPESFSFTIFSSTITLSTYPVMVAFLLIFALYFCFCGGQVTVIVADFIQGAFLNVTFVLLIIFILVKFPIKDMFDGLLISEKGQSLIDPFDAGKVKGFNPFYFLISIVGMFWNRLSWQGSQAFNSSARNPHEAKMAGLLAFFRYMCIGSATVLITFVTYMFMHHPGYTNYAEHINSSLSKLSDEQTRDQMLVPVSMLLYIPQGLIGAFAASMLAAFLATGSTYMHSWGSIFVQDIVLPVLKKPLSQKSHIVFLRLSICFVAIFSFVFSLFFKQTQDIYLYFAITAAIWLGGAGTVIVGGLYTRWGNTTGAYFALIGGCVSASSGMICENYWKGWFGKDFYLTGQEVYFWAMLISVILYIAGSLLFSCQKFDLNKILNREINSDDELNSPQTAKKLSLKIIEFFGYTKEFIGFDKYICAFAVSYNGIKFILFIIMTVLAIGVGLSSIGWCTYFKYTFMAEVFLAIAATIWLLLGGIRDLFRFIRDLDHSQIDETDDGR